MTKCTVLRRQSGIADCVVFDSVYDGGVEEAVDECKEVVQAQILDRCADIVREKVKSGEISESDHVVESDDVFSYVLLVDDKPYSVFMVTEILC